MKIKSFLIFGLIIGVVSLFALYPRQIEDPIEKEAVILKSVVNILERAHFKPKDINDDFSKKVYQSYLDLLDGGKRFLIQADVDKLKPYEKQIDDEILATKLNFFNASLDIINAAQSRVKSYYKEILAKPMTFNEKETISYDFDKMPYAKNEKELYARWEKILKANVLDEIVQVQNGQENDSLKVDKTEIKSFATIEKEAREKVLKDYDRLFERMEKLRREDRFSDYINSITEQFDPHTSYFSPNDKEDFDIGMSGRLEGIGARLQADGEYTKVSEIVVGGPAWKEKNLEAGDVIMKVAQEGQPAIDIRGMRLDDVVSKIRGKKGTKVILTVKKVSGTIQNITITRDEVLMDESFAKSVIIGQEGVLENIGYIYLPKFYADFDNNKGRFSFTDVAKEVEKLKKANVNGIILDLRNNPGGSLNDVVKMAGLFIEQGPIVQVKSRENEPYVMNDEDKSYAYDGPMVVLVNHQSASASEILAAALQDYKRAVIIGGTSTYGKGTVQRFVDLDRTVSVANNLKPLGQLKLTIQKYYRINGGSTQLEGVTPDIVLPDAFNYIKIGERENKSAMEWTKIAPARYSQNVFVINNMDDIKAKSKKRVETNPLFKAIDENAHRIKEQSDKKIYTLELDSYKKDMNSRKEQTKKFNALFKEIPGLSVENIPEDAKLIQRDSASIARNQTFIKNIKKDVYIEEAMQVIKDLQTDRMSLTDKKRQIEEKN
ncbi:MAG TPA: carboxy terminal-processing peptidase [Saprospiraceae bacterium]|jgi:carboxyl-terminal processing protease|nr:carboxy terminal-processing peptidase [Saprospiraceae bacterium]